MRKYMILLAFCMFVIIPVSGCQRSYYGKGKAFEIATSKFPGYSNESITALSADNYERFMHASYIIVTDKFGEVHKIKISADIKRHEWDFSNLDSDGKLKNYIAEDGSKKKVGIDVSEHQGVINWEKVSKQIDFAFVRLGYRGYTGGVWL